MAVQQTTTQTILPEWYTQYAQNVLSKAYGATSEPYRKYVTKDAAGNEVPIARIAGFQPEQEEAFGKFKSTMGNYQPYIGASTQALGAGTQSFTAPGVAQRYMNPYLQNVVSGIGAMAGRNLYENILPQVNRTFIGGGTFGGSRSAEFTQRAIRDAQAAALEKQVGALSEGYKSAADLYGAEAERMLEAAPRFAELGAQEQEQRFADIKGLQDIGSLRQQLAQQSADLARQDFEEQRDFPYLQAQRLANIGGAPSATGSGTRIETAPGPSGTSQALGTVATIAGLLGKTGAFGSQGWLSKIFKEGGEVEGPVKDGKRNLKHPMHGLGWLKDVK
jgi:hypothetical protein